MKTKSIKIILALLLLPLLSYAQQADSYAITGKVMTQGGFYPSDIIKLSQFNTGFSTARSTAMGGAFTSLGADLASAHINPAGLGMYRSSEFSITPVITMSDVSNRFPAGTTRPFSGDNSRTRFSVNNVGAAFNVYQGTGGLTSFTMAVSYNKLADYNYLSSVGMRDNGTIGDIYARQLYGIDFGDLEGDIPWYGDKYADPQEIRLWPAITGFQSYFVDFEGKDGEFRKRYNTPGIDIDALTDHYADIDTKGSASEISIAGGFNLRNKVYLGFSIGIVNYNHKESLFYREEYLDNNFEGNLAWMNLNQHKNFSGTGVNFKFGAIYSPFKGLRLGVSVHTPTYSSVKMSYSANTHTRYINDFHEKGYSYTPENRYTYDFDTPTRLMFGASYTFGSKAILSFDYERTWNNNMKYKGRNIDGVRDMFRNDFRTYLQPSNTFRAGGEFRPTSNITLRAGYTHSGEITSNAFRKEGISLNETFSYRSYSISAGLGFRLGRRTTLDLTYVYMNTKQTTYDLYYANIPEVYPTVGGVFETLTGRITPTIDRHVAMCTLSIRL